MKLHKSVFIFPVALLALGACASNPNKVDCKVWEMDPVNMCSALINQNKEALTRVEAKCGAEAAAAVKPLYQELDMRTNAVCRSRIAREFQNEKIKELRAEFKQKIDEALSGCKAWR